MDNFHNPFRNNEENEMCVSFLLIIITLLLLLFTFHHKRWVIILFLFLFLFLLGNDMWQGQALEWDAVISPLYTLIKICIFRAFCWPFKLSKLQKLLSIYFPMKHKQKQLSILMINDHLSKPFIVIIK